MLKGSSVFHTASLPWAYPLDGNTLRVVLRAERGLVSGGKVLCGDRYQLPIEPKSVPLVKTATDQDFDYFEAELYLDPPRFRYAFLLNDGIRSYWFHERGLSFERPKNSFFQYPYINAGDALTIPDWVTDGVVYQVFPDRFARGNPALNPPKISSWSDEKPTAMSLYGGDLEGIMERLPYLQDLGITVLYLTPIFQSPSNHKYDTTDYYRIDPAFGDEDTLRSLVEKCHGLGIKVILDAVFNHCGMEFFAFQDVLKRNEDSPYASWFHIHSFPVQTAPVPNYETFGNGIATMPKLRTEHPEVRRYLLDVGRYWIESCNIDGWRIDVANEVEHSFWREFRSVVKDIKPNAYIVGEVWHEGSAWLQGDEFDGITNYPIREACLEFFARGNLDAERFAELIQRNLYIYAEPMLRASWNLLGSHDTERFLTACGDKVERAALAAVFNLTWLGTPLIYYGDEIGMKGENDPDCRRPMIWKQERWNQDLHRIYKTLIRLRKEERVLRHGRATVLYANAAENTLAYLRYGPETNEGSIVAMNNSGTERIMELGDRIPLDQLENLCWHRLTGEVWVEQGGRRLILGPYASIVGL